MSDGRVDVDIGGFSTVDHQAINEFHALGTLTSELSGDDNFTTLGSRLHDEAEDTIAGSKSIHYKLIKIGKSSNKVTTLTFAQPNHQ